jgi:hypothetical protein
MTAAQIAFVSIVGKVRLKELRTDYSSNLANPGLECEGNSGAGRALKS